ncbi:MAG: FAD-dependent oxidoreductase [Firmicutes bacterium]|nr:FAD-dependent oxidoreductase [Bacillota bacterium]
MKRVVIAGGGWAGCGAAFGARKRGVEVVLIERSNHLMGVGYHAGLNAYNGRYTIMLEAKALGGTEIFDAVESTIKYRVDLPHQKYGYLYDNFRAEAEVLKKLEEVGVNVLFERSVVDADVRADRVTAVKLDNGEVIEADAFVDATGGAGPEGLCRKYGRGCVVCSLRCPTFGPRVSLTARCGVKENMARLADGKSGGMSNACSVDRESVAREIVEQIEKNNGFLLVPAPEGLADDYDYFRKIRTQQYLSKDEYEEYLVCVDVGTIKFLSRPYMNYRVLRSIPGFESAHFVEPLSGGRGQAIRFLAMAPRDNRLQVLERPNLFCAGEKTGFLVGVMDAKVTGLLAGNNAARAALGEPLLELPRQTALGEGLAWVNEQIKKEEGQYKKYSFMGAGGLWDHISQKELFTVDEKVVEARCGELGLLNAFAS